jgi:hypothetical protein
MEPARRDNRKGPSAVGLRIQTDPHPQASGSVIELHEEIAVLKVNWHDVAHIPDRQQQGIQGMPGAGESGEFCRLSGALPGEYEQYNSAMWNIR